MSQLALAIPSQWLFWALMILVKERSLTSFIHSWCGITVAIEYWMMPQRKLMEYHSKQPLSHVCLKWQWQERETKGAVGQNAQHSLLSIEVVELLVPKAWLHLPLSSCVCTWLTPGKSNNSCLTWSTIVQLRDLEIKDCLCRAERDSHYSQSVNIPHSIFQYIVLRLNR